MGDHRDLDFLRYQLDHSLRFASGKMGVLFVRFGCGQSVVGSGVSYNDFLRRFIHWWKSGVIGTRLRLTFQSSGTSLRIANHFGPCFSAPFTPPSVPRFDTIEHNLIRAAGAAQGRRRDVEVLIWVLRSHSWWQWLGEYSEGGFLIIWCNPDLWQPKVHLAGWNQDPATDASQQQHIEDELSIVGRPALCYGHTAVD